MTLDDQATEREELDRERRVERPEAGGRRVALERRVRARQRKRRKGNDMSMRQLESAITSEARSIFNNPKLRVKDLMEWSTGQIKPQDGEVVERMPLNGVYVAIKVECDKRSNASVSGAEPQAERPTRRES